MSATINPRLTTKQFILLNTFSCYSADVQHALKTFLRHVFPNCLTHGILLQKHCFYSLS